MSDDRDDRIDELLRSAMNDEAETIMPAGDGLSRIQQRVTARRHRLRWMRPAAALGSAAALALVGVGAYALTTNGTDKLHTGPTPATQPPTTEPPSETPSPSAVPVVQTAFPKLAIFPFTSVAEEKAWETQYAAGHSPWEADATTVSTSWVQNYLGVSEVNQVVQTTIASDGKSADVTLGRTMTAEQKKLVPVTVVRLVKFGSAWIVIGADDPQHLLKLSSPKPGVLATSPLTVTGPGFGVDEAVQLDVRDAKAPISFGTGHASFGNGVAQWSSTVAFGQPGGSDGVLVGLERSMADGGPQRLVALPLQFGDASGSSTPQYFYAIKNSRVTKFASSSGAAIGYLTSPQPGGGASDPQLSETGEQVYYLQGGGTCANALMSVSTAAVDTPPPPQSVASPDTGYVIAGYAVGPAPAAADGNQTSALAVFETACSGTTSPQAKLVSTTTTGQKHVIDFPSVPPGIEGDPSFEPGTPSASDVRYLDAFVRTGNSGYLTRYDIAHDTTSTPSRNACPAYDVNTGLPKALEVTTAGELWFAVQTGQSMQVVHCAAGHAAVAFTIPGNDTPADVDVTSGGGAVLLTDIAGKVWRWDGSGTATQLSPKVPLDHVTW
jgi:hypothetical protein